MSNWTEKEEFSETEMQSFNQPGCTCTVYEPEVWVEADCPHHGVAS